MISLASGIRKLRLACWLAALIGPVALVMSIIEYRHEAALIRFGARAEGTINSFHAINTPRATKIYYFDVTWRNELDGKLYRRDFSTPGSMWPDGPPRQTLTVLYDPKRPQDSHVGMKSQPDLEHIAIASIITILGIAGLAVMHFLASIILRRLADTEKRSIT